MIAMKSFMDSRGVNSGLAKIINDFCDIYKIVSPINKQYSIDERIPLSEWYKILAYLNKKYKKVDLGIEIGKLANKSNFGVVSYLCMGCRTVAEVFYILQHYQRIWYHISTVDFYSNYNDYILEWTSPEYILNGGYQVEARIANDIVLTMIINFINELISPSKIYPKKMEFSAPKPKSIFFHKKFYKCPIHFESSINKIYFSKEIMEMELSENIDDLLISILRKEADFQLKKYTDEIPFNQLIYRNIVYAIHRKRTDINFIAEQMGISSRVLQQKLKNNGTTFSKKLNKVRMSIAFDYLKNTKLNMRQVAEIVGYNEQTSFNRAFKSWTGLSPKVWLESNQSAESEVIIYHI